MKPCFYPWKDVYFIIKRRLITIVLLLSILLCTAGCTRYHSTEEDTTKPETESGTVAQAETADQTQTPTPTPETVVEEQEEEYEKQMWDYLMAQYENEYAAAAIMGNSRYEMDLCPYRYEGDTEEDENGEYPKSYAYTERIDSGEISRNKFVRSGPNGGGYGLFSWTGNDRKEDLYDYAKERGCSIADWKMQLDFTYKEITERYYSLYVALLTADNVKDATETFALKFEKASDPNMSRRWLHAKEFLDKFGSENYTPKYQKGTLVPVNHSYDYMEETFQKDAKHKNIYVYIAQYMLRTYGYIYTEPSGYYGSVTEKGISMLQEENGVESDGILTPAVWKMIQNLGDQKE